MVSIEQPPLSRLICPRERTRYNYSFYLKEINGKFFRIVDSLYYVLNTKDDNSSDSPHHLNLLYWCNNKDSEDYSWCFVCQCTKFATTYYLCNECDAIYHKECVESPHLIRSLIHPKHDLQLLMYSGFKEDEEIFCYYCKSTLYHSKLIYYCFICEFSLDLVCARRPPFLNYQKRHEHTLYHFTRKVDMVCDVCGEVDRKSLIFVCLECDFVVHSGCIYLPFVIRISRHEHRLSFTYSPLTKLSCGVCRKEVDENYGKYSCMKGCAYVVHSKCATRTDVWDGKELEEEPEEVYENLNPFEVIGDKIIQHFSHSHHMRFEKEATDIMYDGEKRCHACVLPLYRGGVYKCVNPKCDFVLHEKCASLPRKKQHMAYRYPLTLQVSDTKTYFYCYICGRDSCGFKYVCLKEGNYLSLDVRCAAISEPFDHRCHKHPLFLTNELRRSKTCSMCGRKDIRTLNCIECDFILCFPCATLPDEVRYDYDEHFLTLSYEENVIPNFCEVCEETLDSPKWIYTCNECGVTLHITCLLGKGTLYIKPAKNILLHERMVSIIPNNGLTRPICSKCERRCQDKVMFETSDGRIFCYHWEMTHPMAGRLRYWEGQLM